jgi:hypothetical protein
MKNQINQDESYKKKIHTIKFDPFFILGLHRSGTTILYEILNKTNYFDVVTAYHILKYDELIYNHLNNKAETIKNELNNFFTKKGIVDRKIDNIKVTADYTQEYCYLLLKKSKQMKITDKNQKIFEELCKKIKFISKNNKPILLKNPYDFSNFLHIKKLYPNSKFIFIHRNPLYLLNSIMKTQEVILKEKSEYHAIFSEDYGKIYDNPLLINSLRIIYSSKVFPFGFFEVLRYTKNNCNFYLKNIKKLSKKDYISIKYEDLCRYPNKISHNIFNFLNIKSSIDFEEFIHPRNLKLFPYIENLKLYVYRSLKPYFEYFNYKI